MSENYEVLVSMYGVDKAERLIQATRGQGKAQVKAKRKRLPRYDRAQAKAEAEAQLEEALYASES